MNQFIFHFKAISLIKSKFGSRWAVSTVRAQQKKRDTQSGSSLGNSLLASVGVERCTVHKKKHTLLPSVHALFLSPRTPHNEREIFNGGMRKTSLTQDKLRPKRQVTPTAARATARFPREVSCHSFFFVMFVSFLFFRSLSFPQGEWEWKSSVGKVASKRKDCDGFFKHKW